MFKRSAYAGLARRVVAAETERELEMEAAEAWAKRRDQIALTEDVNDAVFWGALSLESGARLAARIVRRDETARALANVRDFDLHSVRHDHHPSGAAYQQGKALDDHIFRSTIG